MKIPNDSEITSETNTCQIQDQKTETPKISSTTTKISSNNQTSVEPTELTKPRLHSRGSHRHRLTTGWLSAVKRRELVSARVENFLQRELIHRR